MISVKKGQAAMEFLMTYGWAILVVVSVVAGLAYFGVLSPSKSIPSICMASLPFSCPDGPVISISTNNIAVYLVNGQGYDLVLSSANSSMINLSSTLSAAGCTIPLTTICAKGNSSCPGVKNQLARSGEGVNIIIGCTNLTGANVVKGDITLTYNNPESMLNEKVLMSISGKPS